MQNGSRRPARLLILLIVALATTSLGFRCQGLSLLGFIELHRAGIDKYLGQFTPATSEVQGEWTKHTFDTEDGDGPVCINGTEFTVFTRARDPEKVFFFLNGGGACWQNFYFCSQNATQSIPAGIGGIFAESFDTGSEVIDNPFADWSMVLVSYCDGSVHSGDNDVIDPVYGSAFGIDPPIRRHRGLRNLSAAMDLAKAEFPLARKLVVAGSSAGGVGATGFAPGLARFVFGNRTDLLVFNDAGPVSINPNDTAGIAARAADWQFGQVYPESCEACSDTGDPTEAIHWRFENDSAVRESFYSTDGDATNRFFLNVPTQAAYRQVLLDGHDPLHEAYPDRYKRFIRSGDDSHTAFGSPIYYLGEIDGVRLHEFAEDFVQRRPGPNWIDLVEDFIPLP